MSVRPRSTAGGVAGAARNWGSARDAAGSDMARSGMDGSGSDGSGIGRCGKGTGTDGSGTDGSGTDGSGTDGSDKDGSDKDGSGTGGGTGGRGTADGATAAADSVWGICATRQARPSNTVSQAPQRTRPLRTRNWSGTTLKAVPQCGQRVVRAMALLYPAFRFCGRAGRPSLPVPAIPTG